MKKFIKALNRESKGFAFSPSKVSMKKTCSNLKQVYLLVLKQGNSPGLLVLMMHWILLNSAWMSLKPTIANFLGNHRNSQYRKVVYDLMKNFRQLGARMSVKMHFLRSHLNYYIFQKNVETSVENRVSAFSKISVLWRNPIKVYENVNFLADYCWCLKRDVESAKHLSIPEETILIWVAS